MTLREKFTRLKISDTFINKLEDEYKLIKDEKYPTGVHFTRDQYADHVKRCKEFAHIILEYLDKP